MRNVSVDPNIVPECVEYALDDVWATSQIEPEVVEDKGRFAISLLAVSLHYLKMAGFEAHHTLDRVVSFFLILLAAY
jgi:hypothetical protein